MFWSGRRSDRYIQTMAKIAASRVASFGFMAVSAAGSVGGVVVGQLPFGHDIVSGAGTDGALMAVNTGLRLFQLGGAGNADCLLAASVH